MLLRRHYETAEKVSEVKPVDKTPVEEKPQGKAPVHSETVSAPKEEPKKKIPAKKK